MIKFLIVSLAFLTIATCSFDEPERDVKIFVRKQEEPRRVYVDVREREEPKKVFVDVRRSEEPKKVFVDVRKSEEPRKVYVDLRKDSYYPEYPEGDKVLFKVNSKSHYL